MMLGEFGWFVAGAYAALAFVFWMFRDRLSTGGKRSTVTGEQ